MASIFKAGNIALITGGANGIGLAVAQKCHKFGMSVIIVDNNEENLKFAKKMVGERATGYAVDVSRSDEWNGLKKIVEKDFGHVDLLFLNAGIGMNGNWVDPLYFQKTLNVNILGVINGISTFLGPMQATATTSQPAAIIVTGSKQGITNPPGNPAYNMSKAAVRSLTEHLSYDLRASPISVHLLVPGWTYTGLSGASPGCMDGKPEGAWTPDQVADYLEEKMDQGKFYVICPDNDVTEETDKKRILWAAGDVVEGRPPLTRWREDWKETAASEISQMKI